MLVPEMEKYFDEQLFIPDLQSVNKSDVLEELVKPLVEKGAVKNSHIILETLKKRETLGSTGIGKGVAVPHCRTLSVPDVSIVVGISNKGVDFDAIDGKKADLFFLIVAPPQDKSNLYLPILGKIVELVRVNSTRKALMGAQSFDEFIGILKEAE